MPAHGGPPIGVLDLRGSCVGLDAQNLIVRGQGESRVYMWSGGPYLGPGTRAIGLFFRIYGQHRRGAQRAAAELRALLLPADYIPVVDSDPQRELALPKLLVLPDFASLRLENLFIPGNRLAPGIDELCLRLAVPDLGVDDSLNDRLFLVFGAQAVDPRLMRKPASASLLARDQHKHDDYRQSRDADEHQVANHPTEGR